MPRQARVAVGDVAYHVLNRSNGRATIFHKEEDYKHFESLLLEGVELIGMRLLAYVIMSNHWHLVLYPKNDTGMSEFMRWVTTTHVRQRRVRTQSIGHGHLYQGTYKSFPIEEDQHLINVIRYVEQNPLRAHMVDRAEDWPWSSLLKRMRRGKNDKKLLAPLPTTLPHNYLESVNTLLKEDDLLSIRNSIRKGVPYGTDQWIDEMITTHDLQGTLREPGRPRKH